MKINVTSVDLAISAVLREKVQRRVLLDLSRFGPQIRKVTVRLIETVNPLGGVDQRCRMRASLVDGNDIHVETINWGFEAVVARAAIQLAKRLDSSLDAGKRGRVASK